MAAKTERDSFCQCATLLYVCRLVHQSAASVNFRTENTKSTVGPVSECTMWLVFNESRVFKSFEPTMLSNGICLCVFVCVHARKYYVILCVQWHIQKQVLQVVSNRPQHTCNKQRRNLGSFSQIESRTAPRTSPRSAPVSMHGTSSHHAVPVLRSGGGNNFSN